MTKKGKGFSSTKYNIKTTRKRTPSYMQMSYVVQSINAHKKKGKHFLIILYTNKHTTFEITVLQTSKMVNLHTTRTLNHIITF